MVVISAQRTRWLASSSVRASAQADQVVGRAQDSEAGAEQLDEVEEVAEPVALRQLGFGLDPEIDAVAFGQRQHRRRPHGPFEVDVELDLRQRGDGLGGDAVGAGIRDGGRHC